jgi:general secretion pathway protein H
MAPTDKKVAKVSMQTSATGISIRRTARHSLRANRGFSLLELLVVVTIIGIFAGVAVLSMGVLGSDRTIEREALRLKSLMELVREEAVMQSRDFGVLFGEDGYRFYTYDYQQLKWVPPSDDKLFAEHALEAPLNMTLRVEDRDLVLETPERDSADEGDTAEKGDSARGPEPQVLILSSGEMTPFEADIYRDFTGGRFVLTAGLDGQIEITQDGFDNGG